MNEDIKKEPLEQSSAPMVAENDPIVNEFNIDHWIETRQEFKTKVGTIMVQGFDYHIIKDKKSLSKGGAEKIASIFGWVAEFKKDSEALEMIGVKGWIAFVCDLTKNGISVGQGRGASKVTDDINKDLKMAQKSAFIDAVLRASGLSDIYTQDLEDMPAENIGSYQSKPKEYTATPKQKVFILKLMTEKGYTLESLADDGIVAGTPPSEVIDFLLNAQSKIGSNGTELPTIQQEEIDTDSPEVRI